MLRRLSPAAIAVAAFFALVALPRAAIPLIDGDVWWHIHAGREVLASGSVPRVDTWSIVAAGQPWTSQDWLSNVVLAALDGIGPLGWTLASLLYAALVTGALAVLWLALSARGARGWLGRILWLAAGLTVAGATIGVRVQVVDLLLASLTILVLWQFQVSRRRTWLIGLPIISIAWANLHAGWVLLFLLGGAALVGEGVDRLRHRSTALDWHSIGWLGAGLGVALIAISVNPNGLALYGYPLETASIAAHREYLAEWRPPDIGTLPGQLFAAFVVLGVVPALAFGWSRMRAADLLTLLGLTVMAASAARFLLVMPIAAAICSLALDPRIAASSVGRAVSQMLDRMARPARSRLLARVNLGLAAGVALLGVVVALARVAPHAQQTAIRGHMPVEAVDWLLTHDVGKRPFNTYSWGGYLGLHRPELPVYIDGRSDIYGDGPIRAYARAVLLEDDPAELFDRYRIDHVLFNSSSRLAGWLDAQSDWERVYRDALASVWARR